MARVRWQGADRQSLALCHCSLWLKSPYLMLCAQRSISGFPNCKRREVCGAPGAWQGGLAVRRSSSRGRAINFCAAQSKVNVQVAKEDAPVSLPCRPGPASELQSTRCFWGCRVSERIHRSVTELQSELGKRVSPVLE